MKGYQKQDGMEIIVSSGKAKVEIEGDLEGLTLQDLNQKLQERLPKGYPFDDARVCRAYSHAVSEWKTNSLPTSKAAEIIKDTIQSIFDEQQEINKIKKLGVG